MIKTGIDLIQISKVVDKINNNNRFLDVILTAEEKNYCNSKIGSVDDEIKRYQSVAGIYAVKEAFFKAIGCGVRSLEYFKYIEVNHAKSGKPCIEFKDGLSKVLEGESIKEIDVSISHNADMAVAICVIKT